ncbi:non-canonical purine NTP diphosphatase [Olivibacter sitiensis]|uniref:non-canonical purine NTP diphosphatase n=1 Tax=Olivibacter sitiensis TaxID=376470 RepID=UPI000400BEF9|nr:non-canonical purine NTP diphosphatase [Olivibacter sitiensis]
MSERMELVFASNNVHKLKEIQSMLGDKASVKSLDDIGCNVDIPETGLTFAENAKQKSDYVAVNYDMDCFADDSGLEVEALGQEPGVFSARYSGTRDMEANIDLLLTRLKNNENRKARFRTVICLHFKGKDHFFEGTIQGHIREARHGVGGFGYDPIFIPNGHERTFAEMSQEEKNSMSHRSIAVAKLVDFLKQQPLI